MAARNNRPRTSYLKEDNGDEVILWSSIVEKIKKAGAANKKYDELIPLGEENLWDNNGMFEYLYVFLLFQNISNRVSSSIHSTYFSWIRLNRDSQLGHPHIACQV